MRILLLTQWFDPEPFFKGLYFAKALQNRGVDVEVLTGFPNYPGGKVYPGYSIRPFQREILEGVRINRVALYPSHDSSGIKRIVNYISFCISAIFIGPFVVRKPDIIYVYNLPTLGFVANVFKFFFQSKIIIDIQDLWPESVFQSKMMGFKPAHSMLKNFTDYIYLSADHITVLSPGFADALEKRKIHRKDVTVIYNWCFEQAFVEDNIPIEILSQFKGKFNVVFAGTMGKMQSIDSIIEAASIISKKNTTISFWFIGGGVEVDRLKKIVAKKNLQNVQFVPRMIPNDIGKILKEADLLLVHLKNDPLFEITIPSKIQAYLYAGKPILVGVKGDAANLVSNAGAGFSCEPENPYSIAETVLKMSEMTSEELKRMGESGKKYYMKNLSFDVGVSNFLEVFKKITN